MTGRGQARMTENVILLIAFALIKDSSGQVKIILNLEF